MTEDFKKYAKKVTEQPNKQLLYLYEKALENYNENTAIAK